MKLYYDGAAADVPARATLTCDLARLVGNYRRLARRAASEGADPIAVVKADAYGHGMRPVARALYLAGARRFAVAELAEGVRLRPVVGDSEILVLGPIPPEGARLAARAGLTATVYSIECAKALSQALGDARLAVHIKLNSGMNRYGFPLEGEALDKTVRAVLTAAAMPALRPTGIYTHLAAADEDASLTDAQLLRLEGALSALAARGLRLPHHTAASAAMLSRGALGGGAVRLGLSLYGYAPTGDGAGLLPVGRLVAPLAQVYTLPAGARVGYGGTYTARGGERIGILTVGYADGLPRGAAGARVRVAGRPCPIVGRVSMDSAAVLLPPDLPVGDGHLATVFGEETSDLFALAGAAGTIPYEILARLGPRVERMYKNEDFGHFCAE